MAEDDVNYASIVFKTKNCSKSTARKEEEIAYNEVNLQRIIPERTYAPSAGVLQEEKSNKCRHHPLVWCLGILCAILLLGITTVCVYLTMLSIDKLQEENENLRRNNTNLSVQFVSLTQAHALLEKNSTELIAANQNLTASNQELRNKTRRWNELNVTRVQWSIDAYCPKNNRRCCKACQTDWDKFQSSCYAVNDRPKAELQTWAEARDDCRGKNSDLPVIGSQKEKEFINKKRLGDFGYWTGLRVDAGAWMWVDGSQVTADVWIQSAADEDHCVIFENSSPGKLKAVKCTEKHRWICEKEALSL